ncbi:MAG TPA: tRNA(Ile)-lysidine synthetase, partial [Deltaproteobacteria bacterium]|nr:tRNA(Ile)-lysidine synthetase [Deltaproteobacteria bacterium]
RFTQKPKERSIEDIFAINYGKNDIPPLNLTLDVMTEEKKPQQFEFDKNVAYFDMDKIGSLSIRTFRNGDRFVPLGMKYSVKLKDFFISLKIPKEKRRYIPLLISEKDIIWVIGYRIDDRYRITDRTQQILKVVAEYH